ncbi:MAG: pseudouridine synthase [Actinomycetota bacterium]
MRLQKVLAAGGVGSRRTAEELIDAGRVRVDGDVVRVQGMRVDPSTARIEVDGERVNVSADHEYLIMNKPSGVLTTADDPQGRPTVLDLVKSRRRLFPVGRLDADTMGLLLLTDNGELAHRLAHPRYEVPRTYVAEVKGNPSPDVLARLTEGVLLEDGPAAAKSVRLMRTTGGRCQVEIVMTEGRKREVRRMFDVVECPVVYLARVAFGTLRLDDLPSGKTRSLTPAEVGRLLESVGL